MPNLVWVQNASKQLYVINTGRQRQQQRQQRQQQQQQQQQQESTQMNPKVEQ